MGTQLVELAHFRADYIARWCPQHFATIRRQEVELTRLQRRIAELERNST
jgi:hypothetical protein